MSDVPGRRVVEIPLNTVDKGRRDIMFTDRISISDIMEHLTLQELYRLMTGIDEGTEVNQEFRDFLILENFVTR
jgi:hypothetical protein